MSIKGNDAGPLAGLWILDPEVVFLNHGSFGACPSAVLERQRELRERLERQPVRFLVRELEELMDESRRALASYLGADAAGLAFVPNASAGVNAVLRSLRFEPGDEIILTNHEYNACANVCRFVSERAGARAVVFELPLPILEPGRIVERVLAAVTPRTRIALLDHVTSQTGMVFPIESLVRELQARGVDALVDGAHAPGMLPLDLTALGAAYYTGNCHKWMCAPKGAAFLHVREDRRDRIHPIAISHGLNTVRTDRSRFLSEFDWTGTQDPTPALCVPRAIEVMGGLYPGGWDELRRRNRELALEGRRLLNEALEVEPICPDGMIGSMASITLPDGDPDAAPTPGHPYTDPLQAELLERHAIEAPVIVWPAPPHRLLRISAQAYNTRAQIDRLASALRAWSRQGVS